MGTYMISISSMEENVKARKTYSSARNYLNMLGLLKEYVNGDTIALENITADFVCGFGNHMFEKGIAVSSVTLYKQMLRATLKKELPASSAFIKQAFATFDYKSAIATRCIGRTDIKRILKSNLNGLKPLQKIRDLFMYCIYGGGLTLSQVKEQISQNTELLPHQKEIVRNFTDDYNINFCDYVSSITDDEYANGLQCIKTLLGLKKNLNPAAAAEGWIAAARDCNLSFDIIVGTVRQKTSFHNHIQNENTVTCNDCTTALQLVAASINEVSPRWYVMRCFDNSPQNIAEEIEALYRNRLSRIDTFFLPNIGKMKSQSSPLASMLFFRCTQDTALRLKRCIDKGVSIYTFHGSDVPAYIPDKDMKTFMFLADIAGDTITCYFPEEVDKISGFSVGETVTVDMGAFSGEVGVVEKISKNMVKVFIRIEALNGAIITVELPAGFLKRQP